MSTRNDTIPAASLYSKLAAVMSEIGYVEKKGYNNFHRYKYVTEADLVDAVREKLAARNIVLIPSVVAVDERGVTSDKGKQSTVTTVRVAFTFCDGDSGETHRAEWAGAGDDPADKGLYKAYTGAVKYFLMKSFLIPTGDDPEADERTDDRSAGGQHRTVPPLSPEKRQKVLAAVAQTDITEEEWRLYRTSLGALSDEALTADHARAIRAWLDGRAAAASTDVPVPWDDLPGGQDPDAAGGQFDLEEARAGA